jgi:hypothetical protein
MKLQFLYAALLGSMFFYCSCKKNDNSSPSNNTGQNVQVKGAGDYKITTFYLDGENSSYYGPYLHQFQAYDRVIISNSYFINQPTKEYMNLMNASDGTYGLRYLGNCELIDPNKFYNVNGEVAFYAINDSLLGKPVFEIYELATNKVYQRFTASKDSCSIYIDRGWWSSGTTHDTAGFRRVYNAIIDTALNGRIFRGTE